MRERERLDDFKGGHVACRGCKRLLYFDPEALRAGTARVTVCCGIAYAPERSRIDVVIYDRLAPEDFVEEEVLTLPVAPPIEIHDHDDPVLAPSVPETYEDEGNEAELAALLVTPETAAERHSERVATLKARQGR